MSCERDNTNVEVTEFSAASTRGVHAAAERDGTEESCASRQSPRRLEAESPDSVAPRKFMTPVTSRRFHYAQSTFS
jgi:hypothetical protein